MAQESKWPTLDQQLRDAGAIHGSVLESLIKKNQDTQLLRPGERVDDAIGLPLWLRVYFRKQHPEVQAPAGPMADYPEVLNNLLEWMLSHQDLPPKPEEWLEVSDRKPSRRNDESAGKPEGGRRGNER